MIVPSPLVSTQWLADHLDEVRVADVRWAIDEGPKREAFEAGHLPGAVFVDLDADLSDPPGDGGRHPLPSPDRFAAVRGRLGLDDRPVVAYDDQCGAVAGRLWWMLDSIGHEVAVLDGGIGGWPGPLETGPGDQPGDVWRSGRDSRGETGKGPEDGRGPAEPVPWPVDRFIEADDLLGAIRAGALLLDARSRDRFVGTPNPIDDRPGHVPGARSRPWTENIGPDGRFRPIEELRAELEALGLEPGSDLVASCGSGVTACHDLLAARLIGVDGGRLYTGSWSEWSRDPDRPVDVGDA